jgi:hypothetical protein
MLYQYFGFQSQHLENNLLNCIAILVSALWLCSIYVLMADSRAVIFKPFTLGTRSGADQNMDEKHEEEME